MLTEATCLMISCDRYCVGQMLAPLSLLTEDGKDSQTLGKLFSCAMTTFLRVPAPRLLAAVLTPHHPSSPLITPITPHHPS